MILNNLSVSKTEDTSKDWLTKCGAEFIPVDGPMWLVSVVNIHEIMDKW
jgi:hypothetical protein